MYKFWVDGKGSSGPKRDPYARELEDAWPNPKCIVRASNTYPWQDWTWHTPAFNDLIIYQFHVGTFYGPNRESASPGSSTCSTGSTISSALSASTPSSLYPSRSTARRAAWDTTAPTCSRRKWTITSTR